MWRRNRVGRQWTVTRPCCTARITALLIRIVNRILQQWNPVRSFENGFDGDTSLQLALTSVQWWNVFQWEFFDRLHFNISVTELTSLYRPLIAVTGYRLAVWGLIPIWGRLRFDSHMGCFSLFISINSIQRVDFMVWCFGWGEDGRSTMFTTHIQILLKLRIFSLAIRIVGGMALRRPVRVLLPNIHSDTDSSSSTNHPMQDEGTVFFRNVGVC